jgi:hypothetical protein
MSIVDEDPPKADGFGILNAQALNRLRIEADPIFKIGFILAGAHLQCFLSSVRFTLKTTDRLARAQLRLFDRGKPSRESDLPQHLRMIEEARTSLGEIAEIATQEFSQLQTKLHELQNGVSGLAPRSPASIGPYKRRWKVKS